MDTDESENSMFNELLECQANDMESEHLPEITHINNVSQSIEGILTER